eukprot:TRINITY_DN42_c0_g2_i4.p1 TRINITY_DN42_c0_g2~~TRINITY_DN42_c0_g2_i4.p1  ORF type:complete len:341 (+),score=111.97 TRINITY_DN42_c0_g2_i4:68-1090(+)
MTAKNLFCMGNPLLDISAQVDAAFLEKYGLKGGNAILAEEAHMPIFKELSEKEGVVYVPGGATLNSARVANWIGNREGQWVSYAGSVANDEYGKLLESKSVDEKMNMVLYKAEGVPTGTCAVCVVAKERSLVANLAAAAKFDASHVETDAVKKAIESADVYYSAGFFITTCVPALMTVAKHACEKKKTFCLNLSAPFIVDFFFDPLSEALKYVDILFGNETEAESLSKKLDLSGGVDEWAAAVQKMPKEGGGDRIVVFTQGSKCTVIATKDGVKKIDVEKIDASLIRDTNGAGDAFVGGFLAQLCAGKSIEDCVLMGHKSAGNIIQVDGCQFDMNKKLTL